MNMLHVLRAAAVLLVVGPAVARLPEPVIAELFVEHASVPAGGEVTLAIRLTPDPGWHTYWRNPGDAGRQTQAVFTLPDGATVVGPQWPVPKAYPEGELLTYGYSAAHTLLYTLRLPQAASAEIDIRASVDWLVCKDICIPGSAELVEFVAVGPRDAPRNQDIFQAARTALPRPAQGPAGVVMLAAEGELRMALPPGMPRPDAIFPGTQYLVNHAAGPRWASDEPTRLAWPVAFSGVQAPESLDVLVRHGAQAQWVRLESGSVAPVPGGSAASPPQPSEAAIGGVWQALVLAFLGGVLLNLMPCVFPVLAMKAMGLARGANLAEKRTEAWIYTAGILVSFVALAAVLLALRAAGGALGWGFQLQNPAVVAALAVLFGWLGLALAGWTQLGAGLMGVGQGLTQGGGRRSAFFTGVLAVVVASPCTAPFMGAALGYAVTQSAPLALGIFAALGLGLAAPILVLALVPALARRIPRPGPWMNKVKLLLALPLLATAIWLFWVVMQQAGLLALAWALAALIVVAIISRDSPQGRWVSSAALRRSGWVAAAVLMVAPALLPPAASRVAGDWQPWSQEAVANLLQRGQPVFVDFTADWCISCLVNERVALGDADVQALFAQRNVALLKADWTRQDPAITAGLAEFGRNGVPLYLLYDAEGQVEVLPQVLTPGIMRRALQDL